jgi:phosphoribosylformylglycinamidine (FGAM) synthase PurS component
VVDGLRIAGSCKIDLGAEDCRAAAQRVRKMCSGLRGTIRHNRS